MPDVKLSVVKGSGDTEFEIDGLSGATITSRGVSSLIKFWLGDSGFGPYIAKQKQAQTVSTKENNNSNNEGASDG